MKRNLRAVALFIALGAVAVWLATGANRGWTKISEAKRTMDEVTGIEGISYEQRFMPGVDFLGAALLGAGALAGLSFLFRNKSQQSTEPHLAQHNP